MIIRRLYSEREAYISGYINGANEILRNSIREANKTPVRYNGKALKEMIDYTERMEDKIPDMAEESVEEEKEFGDKEPPRQGNKSPGDREIVPDYIVKKVKAGEGVIHEYKGYWRIVSMKTNPPTFWNAHYKTREDAEAALRGYRANKNK